MKCAECNMETTLPFTCPYCHQNFCGKHHLPENHACKKAPPRENLVEYVYTPVKEKAEVSKAIEKVEGKFWHRLRRKLGL